MNEKIKPEWKDKRVAMNGDMQGKEKDYLKIFQQVGVSYFFNFLIILFQPLLIFLLTRLLSVEEYGVYSLMFTTVSLLSVILRLGLVDYIRIKIPGMREEARGKVLLTLLVFSGLALLITALIFYSGREWMISALAIEKYAPLWGISLAIIFFTTLNDLIDSYLISIKKISLGSLAIFLTRSFWVVLLLTAFLIFDAFSLEGVFWFWLAGAAISFSFAVFCIHKEIVVFFKEKCALNLGLLRRALLFSLPLAMMVTLSFVIDASDRYIINYYIGKSAVAIYSLAYGLVTMVASIPIIFQGAITPYFAEKWNLRQDSSSFFNVMLKYSLLVVIPSIIGLLVLREEIITLISGEKYLTASPLITVLIIYPLFAVLIEIINTTLLLRNMVKQVLFIYLAGAIFNIVFNITFMPLFGVVTAAYSITLTYLLVLALMFYFRPREIILRPRYLAGGRTVLAALIMGWFISFFDPNSLASKIGTVLIGGMVYFWLLFLLKVFSAEEKEFLRTLYHRVKQLLSPAD